MSEPTTKLLDGAQEVPFPGGGDLAPREREVRIAFEKRPYADMIGHAVTEPDVELCGVLVGHVRKDKYGPWLHVIDIIRGEKANQKNAQVTFTHDTWNHIHAEMDKHPDRKILGWYHTHGGFGIFLSDMDTFIHENFFTEPYHFAYVYDPLAGTEGFFFREGKQFHQATRYWVGGNPREVLGARPEVKPAAPSGGAADAVGGAALTQLSRQLASLQSDLRDRDGGGSFLQLAVVLALVAMGGLYVLRGLNEALRANLRRERVMVKVLTDPTTGAEFGLELIPLPLRKAEVAPGLVVYQDRESGRFYASDSIAAMDSSTLTLEEYVQARFQALQDGRAARAPTSPGAAPPALEPPQEGGPNMLVVLLVVGLVAAAFVGAAVLVRRRAARK